MRDAQLRPPLAAVARQQQGLVTRAQALASGYSAIEVRRLTETGAWTTVRRGVFTVGADWQAVPERDRDWLRDVAAHLTMTRPHLLSHDSAARAWGLPVLARTGLSHVTRPGVGGSRTEHGVKHHLSRVDPARTAQVGDIPVTGLARTGLDIAREHGFAAGVVTLDAVRRLHAPHLEFLAELALMRSWPGVTQARAAFAFSDGGAESPGESLTRIAVAELGVGSPVTQFAVEVDGWPAWCDVRVGCHVFEFDGRLKYRRPEDGGVASRAPEEIVWQEKLRENAIRRHGLGVSRIVWSELFGAARPRLLARLADEYATTVRRFGTTLPEPLAQYAAQHPRRLRPPDQLPRRFGA